MTSGNWRSRDLHIHVPAGAVPKDGPSAGVAMYTAIASLFLDTAVQPFVAMTGEITLRGRVLPIGGVKEKTLAAMRAGIKKILLPDQNRRDMEEVDAEVKKKCHFVFVETVDQVLDHALLKKPSHHRVAVSDGVGTRLRRHHRRGDGASTAV